jgi:hypothetical protein
MTDVIEPGSLEIGPRAELEAAPVYLRGFPMPARVTLTNESARSTFYAVKECALLVASNPVEFVWTRGGGGGGRCPAAPRGTK